MNTLRLKTQLLVVTLAAMGVMTLFSTVRTAAQQTRPAAQNLPREQTMGQLERVAEFRTQMPTGVTVSQTGRIFVNYPRWEDPVEFTVAELHNGQAVPYPEANINRLDMARAADTFVSVQSVVVDPRDRLWIVDTDRAQLKITEERTADS